MKRVLWENGIASFQFGELDSIGSICIQQFDNAVWDLATPPDEASVTVGDGRRAITARKLDTKLPIKDSDVVVLLWYPYTLGFPSLVADLHGVRTFRDLLQRVHDRASAALPARFARNVYATIGDHRAAAERRLLATRFELGALTVLDLVHRPSFAGTLTRSATGVWTFETT